MPDPDLSTSRLPLRGLTVLAVEGCPVAADTLREMCHGTGARLRLAADLRAAHAHLRVYRPDVVIIGLDLPDGAGVGLIGALAQGAVAGQARGADGPLILATSHDPKGEAAALLAGAAAFLNMSSNGAGMERAGEMQEFLALLMARAKVGHSYASDQNDHSGAACSPDAELFALRDDLVRATGLLDGATSAVRKIWQADFLASLAHQSMPPALAEGQLRDKGGFTPVAALLRDRIAAAKAVTGSSWA